MIGMAVKVLDLRSKTDSGYRPCSRTAVRQVSQIPGVCRRVGVVVVPLQVSLRSWKNWANRSRGDRNGPPVIRRLSKFLSKRLTAWQTLIVTMLWLYVGRNFAPVMGLECPEPLANLYSRSYFRATWVTTALDAGFWTAMRIKPKWIRDVCSMVFSVYYLFAAELADEKVRKVRGMLTLEHLRVSWNKPQTPYLKFATTLLRPTFMRHPPRAIRIARPKQSTYQEPVQAWLYFDGPISDIKRHDKVILDVPGGGFVAMNPRIHDDKLMAWAGKTGLPVLSLDYKKAPEHPYPYALNECYDVYHMLVASRGKCIGMSGEFMPKIVVAGDSAGGNLAVGMLLMILQSGNSEQRRWHGEQALPLPEAVVLIYPALDVNIGNWMTDEQMSLINERQHRKAYRGVISQKSGEYRKLTPDTPHESEDEDSGDASPEAANGRSSSQVTVIRDGTDQIHPNAAHNIPKPILDSITPKPKPMKTRLAMSSMISYFNDRILTPEMMRAMIILYIGPHNRPDFSTDFLLSPVLAPESLLARFPKTYIITGERDPLVDDTVIFAGRLRQAHRAVYMERQELGLIGSNTPFRESDVVEVTLIPGISHGFLQFPGIFPEGWKYIHRCSDWMLDIFERSDLEHLHSRENSRPQSPAGPLAVRRPDGMLRQRSQTWDGRQKSRSDSSDAEDKPLEMTRISSPSTSNGHSDNKNGTTKESTSGTPASAKKRTDSSQRKHPLHNTKRRSLVSLASTDDLLGRRMKGLAGGLMGNGEDDNGPPTP
jgi:acetyl esterase/lipase